TNVFISYYDLTNGDLRFAIRSPCHPSCGFTWSSSAVDAVGNVGGYTSQILTATGSGVAYYDFTNLDLKYAWSTGGAWNLQTVDTGGDVGRYASATAFGVVAPNDSVAITYYDTTKGDLKYAQRVGSWES